MSDSLWPHELHHARLPCPSLSPGVCSNSCPLSWWCHPIISSSFALFFSCPQSFPASGSFPVSQLFIPDGQSIGASASVFTVNIQGWFPLGLILEPKRIEFATVSIVSPSICHEVMRLDAMILVFWMLSFKPAFPLSSFNFIKRLFSSFLFSSPRVVSSAYLRLLIFLSEILVILASSCLSLSWYL